MPKLSVYIPDDLWNRAQEAAGEHNTSQLIQRALQLMVERTAGGTYKESRPLGSEQTLAILKDVYSEEARAHLLRGYQSALNYLSAYRVPWHAFQDLSDRDFDLKRWLQPWINGFLDGVGSPEWNPPELPDWFKALGQDVYLGEFAKPIDGDGFYPDRTYLDGFGRAMRDVWRSVEFGPEPQQESEGTADAKGVTKRPE